MNRRRPLLHVITLAFIAALSVGPATAQTLTGKPRIIDGDSIELGGQTLDLYGIDAPEERQMCQRSDGTPWRCGQEATFALARLIENHWVECQDRTNASNGTPLVVCRIGGVYGFDLNSRMVAEGWAIADRSQSDTYRWLEAEAKAARRGIWQGAFEAPAKWRDANP